MANTNSLHFMCGKAGAGKSTLAKVLAREHRALHLSEDIWLARLYPNELRDFNDYLRLSARIRNVAAPLIIGALEHQSVVLDFPANTVKSRQWFKSIFQQAQTPHTLHHLSASNDLCLRRIAVRNEERPEGSHVLDEATFMHITSMFEAPSLNEGFNVQLHEQKG